MSDNEHQDAEHPTDFRRQRRMSQHYLKAAWMIILGTTLFGCTGNEADDEPSAESGETAVDHEASPEKPKSQPGRGVTFPRTDVETEDAVADFIFGNESGSFCRDVLCGMSLREFLKTIPEAKENHSQSRLKIGYRAYNEFWFLYEFLDGELISIRGFMPRSHESAAEWIDPYVEAFGSPPRTVIPADYRQQDATRYMAWLLPDHNLGVRFVFLPAQSPTDLNLFVQYMNLEKWEDLLQRLKNSL